MPVSKFEKIVNATMWRNVIGQSILQIAVLLVMLFWGQDLFDLPFEPNTPFYADEAYILLNPSVALFDYTNKTELYTMIFQTFVFL